MQSFYHHELQTQDSQEKVGVARGVFDTIAEKTAKEDIGIKLTKSKYRKFLLEQRKLNLGALAVLQKEYGMACVEKSVEETDAYIIALQAQMDTL